MGGENVKHNGIYARRMHVDHWQKFIQPALLHFLCPCPCSFLVCYIPPPLWHAFSTTALVFFSQSMCKTVNGCNSCRAVAALPTVMVLLPEVGLLICYKSPSYSENIQFFPSLTVTVACDCKLLLVSCAKEVWHSVHLTVTVQNIHNQ